MKSYDFEKRKQKIQLKRGLVYVLQKQYLNGETEKKDEDHELIEAMNQKKVLQN